MRCPKCGYITFDHLEFCPKCKKNIAKVSEQLSGDIFKVEVPVFLKFENNEHEMASEASVDIPGEEENTEQEMTVAGDDSPDIEFSFEEDESVNDDSPAGNARKEEIVDVGIQAEGLEESPVLPDESDDEKDDIVFSGFDLDLEERKEEEHEESKDDEKDDIVFSDEEDFAGFDLDEGDEESTDGDSGLKLDFSELDIADLAPPAAEENKADTVEFTPGEESLVTADDSLSAPSGGVPGTGLEDLQTDGFDLDFPDASSSRAASGQKSGSTVKTGTALDDFDFDLGELLSLSDKEK